ALQARVLLFSDAAREEVGIEAGLARERDDVAAVGVDRDDRPFQTGERGLGYFLDLQIERENGIIARAWRLRLEVPAEDAGLRHRAALRIDQDLAEAVGAVKLLLESGFHSGLADDRRARIGGAIDMSQILLTDRAHVPHCIDRERSFRIPACLLGRDVDAGELEPPHRKARNLLIGEVQAYRHVVESPP